MNIVILCVCLLPCPSSVITQSGRTALHWASIFGHIDVIILLLDRGASIDAKDDVSVSVLCAAAACISHTVSVSPLLYSHTC